MIMEIKHTLLMPKTNFEMRGNLAQKEPKLLQRWQESDLYHKILANNKGKPSFVLHDGPPYANGDLHIGHALNKILKDFVVRYKNMNGFYSPFIPGWDTHGLPIESVLAKKGINRKELDIADYRNKCSQYALSQVATQKQQFLRLGSMGDYDRPYVTLTKDYEAAQIEIFGKMALDGLIYKGEKPVYWSPSSETALAEAEIEYQDVVSDSIYVAFKVVDTKKILQGDESFIIWTTTPWTMPGNLGISLNPKLEYGVYETNRGVFIFNVDLKKTLQTKLGFEKLALRKTFLGKELEGIVTQHPMYERTSLIILGEHVTNESGTGCVHTAPGHGEDDFIVGKKYNLGVLCPVDDRGIMMEEAGKDLAGLFYTQANIKIIQLLEEENALLFKEKVTHSYPHDWRTKKPIIFRVTPQWFASIEPIREKLMQEISLVTWYPKWGEVRLGNMIKDRGDWCISRQRVWGVPIPIVYGENEQPIIDEILFQHFKVLFAEHGSNIWFSSEAKDLLPPNYTHPFSPNNIFYKETDIMDVWFDSGSSHTAGLLNRNIAYPVDLYLEGSDQYRGWFNSSLIVGTAAHGKAPYRSVVSHGFALDGKGNKMSKSLGNTVEPSKVTSLYGADILRLWVASVDYQADVRISDSILKQVAETYRKVRNTFRFLLGNLNDGDNQVFNPTQDQATSFETVDLYILNRLALVTNRCLDDYEDYDFSNVLTTLVNFMTNDLSSFYLDITKDILYCDGKTSLRRRQVQTTLYRVLDTLVRLLAPMLPFTCEEIYDYYPNREVDSVHLLSMPSKMETNKKMDQQYDKMLALRDDVLKTLEEIRATGIIGSSQEAHVQLEIIDQNTKKLFQQLSSLEQARFFIVSSVELMDELQAPTYKVAKVRAVKSELAKCMRCWNRFEHVNAEQLCARCAEVVVQLVEK